MSTPAPSEAVIGAWARLVKAQNRVLGAVESDLRKAGFPPLSWYDVLLELRRAGGDGLRPVEIEGRLLLAQHNVSRLLSRLEADGLIERRPCASDGRGHIIALTAAGSELLRRMWPTYRAAIQRHVGDRVGSDEDAEKLRQLLGRLVDGET